MLQAVKRLLGAIGRRVEEMPGISVDSLVEQSWQEISDRLLDSVTQLYDTRRQQYFNSGSGAVSRDIDKLLDQVQTENIQQNQVVYILEQVSQGIRTAFDRRTHKKVALRTQRLSYFYHAAHLLEGRPPQEVTEDVLEHLKATRIQMQAAWGWAELRRLANLSPAQLTDQAQKGLAQALGEDTFAEIQAQPFTALDRDMLQQVIMELGRQALTEAYRDLLLRVISWEWVDYLTQMEALRVSIGLEAYGQRDPLVQYKSKASELFQGLMDRIRVGVVNAMFTSLRGGKGAQIAGEDEQTAPAKTPAGTQAQQQSAVAEADENDAESGDESENESEGESDTAQTSQKESAPAGAPSQPLSKSARRRKRRR